MIYKTVPGPQIVSVTKGKPFEATDLFANIINAEAQDGWVYHSMETITVQEKTGCSFSPQFVNTSIYMLIFYKV
jgi:hypothetical protein